MSSQRTQTQRWRRLLGVSGVALLGLLPLLSTSPAAASGETGLITISPAAPTPQPAGAPITYSLAISCEGTAGISCGGTGASTVTIPLTGTNTVPADMSTWAYNATSGTPGLITAGPTVAPNGTGGYNLVLTLNNATFVSGYSGTITLQVTAPNNVTPNHTTWSLQPSLAGGNITTVVAPTPSTGEATAAPLPVISKFTNDGGSVYVAGSNVTYDINVNCNTGSTGNLFMTNGSLTDPLPEGMTYVSSSPAGGTYDSTTNTVTWTYPTAASTPAGCAAGSTGATSYQVVATTPDPAPSIGSQPLRNIATFAGQGPDATNGTVSGSTNAEADIDIVQTPPTGTCSGPGCPTIAKSSLAPLAITSLPGNQYQGTYAGDWVHSSATPSYTVGAAAGSFRVAVGFPLTGTYETQVVDPLPCLDDVSGQTYSSASAGGSACAHPAFDTTVIDVSGPGLGEALANGWVPTATNTNDSSEVLAPTGSVGSGATSAYFSIPNVGGVATINLPATPFLEGNAITLTLWGYADSSLVNTDVLANTATATPMLGGVPLGPITASANLYILDSTAQLGVSKSFGTLGAGPGGTTVLNIEGAVSFACASTCTLNNDVVLTDLLPTGLSWSNTATTGSFTLAQGSGTSSSSATATVAYLTDYEGTGRNLIRATIPHADFTSGGYWTVSPPTDFFELTTPSQLGTYPNTDQIFLYGYAPTQTDSSCTTPTDTTGGTSRATFESSNPLDLAGDGKTNEDYCQNGATLVVQPSGAAFSLTKTVQGNLDATPKGGLGIGDASGGGTGTGTYVLAWSNVGSDTLDDPVVYDILPYVGDTGVSQGQQGVARGSQFAPVLASVGSLPSGVEVEYSASTNPCRDQVFPNSANMGCVNDWTSTAPGNLSTVKALEFIDTTTQYLAGAGFSVSFTVTVPNGDVNEVAWNSAATNASDVSNPANVPLPAEPPKVGLTAPSGGPALTTTTLLASLIAYSSTPVQDQVNLLGTNGNSGSLAWSLVGPVAPVGGSCSGLTWSGAATVASGTIATPAADGAVFVGPATVQGQGCYSWTENLTLANGGGTAALAAGAENSELIQANPYTTTLTTTATPSFNGTDNDSTDTIVVAGSGIGTGNGAPTSATLSWDLYGPATPVTAGTCAGINWTPFTMPLDSGTINVTGDGSYTTPSTDLTTDGLGCYTYTDSLPQTGSGTAVSTAQGAGTETFILVTAPSVSTSAKQPLPSARTSVSDAVTITGTSGKSGTVAWQLLGPVTVPGGGCSALTGTNWLAAPTLRSGNQNFTNDQSGVTVPAAGTPAGAPGCYSWAETVTGPNFLGPTAVAAGSTGEVFQVVPWQPALATTAVPVFASGSNTASDTVVVSSSDLGGTNGAPASATLTATLYGPVAVPNGGCSAVTNGAWLAAASTSNTKAVVNGTNHTTPITLAAIGCYTYTDGLAATGDTLAVATSAPGVTAETFQLVSSQMMTTSANQATTNPRGAVSDSVTITGTGGFGGTVAWSLVGPVAPLPVGGCSAVTGPQWSSATTVHSGTQAISGDQTALTVPTSSVTIGAPGCYSWAETLTGPNFLGPTTVAAGTSGEIITVQTLQPTLTTTIDPSVSGGTESATDAIVVAGTDIAPGNSTGAPVSGSLAWSLLGPVTPVPAGGCSAVTGSQWSSAAQGASGTITVTGNSTYTTPPTALALGSCYSYTETLAATTDSAAATAQAGVVTETTEVPAAPAVTTLSSNSLVYPHTPVTDSITISGIGGYLGSVAWALVGPVTPVTPGTCNGVNWSSAPGTPVGQGTTPVSSDGMVSSGPVTLNSVGCYSWTDTLTGTFPGTTTVAAGAAGEVVLVQPHQPVLTTTASLTAGAGGARSIVDSIVVSASGIGTGGGAPSSAVLDWSLLGPVAPIASSCSGVSWSGAPTSASGTLTVTGDGSYTTPSSALSTTGCFSYSDILATTADSLGASSAAGLAAETTPLLPPPALTTDSSSSLVHPYFLVSDTVTVSGTGRLAGSLSWSLVGPVAPAADGTCNAVNWTGAPTLTSGLAIVTADGDLTTGPTSVAGVGCYSWTESLMGVNYLGESVVNAGAADEVILVDPFQPVLTTVATLANNQFHDSITVSGSGIGSAPGAPDSALLNWTLLGPAAATDGVCTAVTWTGQPVVATGTITVTGDGTYVTPATGLSAPGCYTFYEQLTATAQSDAASTEPGVAVETAYLAPGAAVAGSGGAGSDGLGSIGTDLGRWLPGGGDETVALFGALVLVLLGGAGWARSRRRRRA